MKTIKFILSAILMMMAFTIQAQTIQVYKDGVVVKEYPASEVKSVEVKPVYYYYAGWKCPETEEELASMATGVNGGYVTNLTGYNSSNPMHDYSLPANQLTNDIRKQYYIVIPKSMNAYDAALGSLATNGSVFTIIGTFGDNYNIWQSASESKYIKTLKIY